jgi:hypothetical protein
MGNLQFAISAGVRVAVCGIRAAIRDVGFLICNFDSRSYIWLLLLIFVLFRSGNCFVLLCFFFLAVHYFLQN